jgi:Spy/CpxP family protein refolding chaperone
MTDTIVVEMYKKEKKMKLNWKTFVLALSSVGALLVMTAAVVVSQGPPGGTGGPPRGDGFRRSPGPRDGMFPMFRDLNLSDDQKAQIKTIMANEAANTRELREKLKALHESEPDPFSATFNEASARADAEARAKIDIELQVSHARTMSQIGAILTTDQKAQLAARRAQFHEGPPPQQP